MHLFICLSPRRRGCNRYAFVYLSFPLGEVEVINIPLFICLPLGEKEVINMPLFIFFPLGEAEVIKMSLFICLFPRRRRGNKYALVHLYFP
jgi:hypothetical protein